ncbi:10790_t:CDS:1, partial [Acaulospora morrowiae]
HGNCQTHSTQEKNKKYGRRANSLNSGMEFYIERDVIGANYYK